MLGAGGVAKSERLGNKSLPNDIIFYLTFMQFSCISFPLFIFSPCCTSILNFFLRSHPPPHDLVSGRRLRVLRVGLYCNIYCLVLSCQKYMNWTERHDHNIHPCTYVCREITYFPSINTQAQAQRICGVTNLFHCTHIFTAYCIHNPNISLGSEFEPSLSISIILLIVYNAKLFL